MNVNEDAVLLYWKIRTQVKLSAMGDIIGIDHSAIRNIMELYEVDAKKKMFDSIIECFNIEQELAKELRI